MKNPSKEDIEWIIELIRDWIDPVIDNYAQSNEECEKEFKRLDVIINWMRESIKK